MDQSFSFTLVENKLSDSQSANKTEPSILPLSIIKAYLRINYENDDEYIKSLLTIAISYAEHYMQKSLVVKNLTMHCHDPVQKKILLSLGPVRTINKVTIKRQEEIIPSDAYVHDEYYLTFLSHTSMSGLSIDYIAGHTPDSIPDMIKEGLLLHIKSIYFQHVSKNSILPKINAIYAPFRLIKLY